MTLPNRPTLATLAMLTLVLLFASPGWLHAANPGVSDTSDFRIFDTQATNVFASATVTEGGTNVLTVFVDFAPTSFGNLNPLPTGVVQDGTNYLIGPTNGATATTILRSLLFTPAANVVPVPNFSNVVFHVRVEDAEGNNSSTRTTTMRVTATNDPLTLTANAPFTHNITDQTNTVVFTGVTIADVDDQGAQPLEVTISLDATNKGTFTSLSGFVNNGSNYVFNGTPAAATTAIRALRFVPTPNHVAPGLSETTTFTISVDDSYASPATSSAYSVTALSVNDAPTLTPGTPVAYFITDQATNTHVFTNATIADPDLSGTQPVSVTIAHAATNSGTFALSTNGPPGFTNAGPNYAFTGTPSNATAAIRALVFLPTPNLLPVGQSNTTTFTITVNDTIAAPVTNTTFSVNALSVNDAPLLTGVTAVPLPVETGHTLAPFSVLTLLDADQNLVLTNTHGEDLDWQVTLTGDDPVGHLEVEGTDVGTTYSSASDPDAATLGLRALIYRAPSLALAGTNTLMLAITASDGHGGTVSNVVLLELYSLVLPPELSGTQSGQLVNDNTTIAAFSKVNIQSFNGSSITMRIGVAGVTNDAQGQLINLGSFTRTTPAGATSRYEFTGTSENATAGIRALLFQPTANRIHGSSNETATFSITLVDGVITNSPDLSTTVIVVPVNDPPVIAGISPLVTIQDNQTLPPFTTVLITDADETGQQPVSATVTLDVAAKGAFTTNSLTASGFTSNNGSYTFSGPPALLTAAIRQLVFIPTPNRVPVGLTEITTFNIALNDAHGGLVANSGTSVRVASVSGLPIVNLPTPQPVSIPIATNIFPFQQVSVSDPTLLKLNVRINNTAQGAFTTNSVVASGFTNRGGGNYYVSGYASNVTAALAQLDFSPATNLALGAVINFTISVTNALPNFVSANHAIVLRTVQNSFIVTKLTDYDPTANVPASQQYGTLRKAISAAKNNDHITFDIRSAVPGQPDYPAVIRLVAPLVLDNNLTFDGPGAERLAISGDSDGNGTPDVQLFVINAAVTMHRLTFTKGYASGAGGALAVSESGDLRLSYCAVTDSTAEVWGGGVDVDQGSLVMDHCLIAGNRTTSALGQGGGGVSLYTVFPCTIVHTTFATNRQEAVGGLGGGALYAETADPGLPFDLRVLNCTFHDNRDLAGHGTSIRPNVFNTLVHLQNTIVADGQGKNIEMDQSGAVLSWGGNISDDATASTFSAGGTPTNTFIFRPPADQVSVPATNLLSALADNGGPTLTFALTTNSPAIGQSVSNSPAAAFYGTLGTDQRGYFRDAQPDIGAFERGAAQRVIIEEIHFNPAAPNTNDEFIEFYVPRDSAALNLGGFTVLVDGVLRHTLTSQALQPGEALVLFSAGAVNNSVPSGVYRQIASGNLSMDNAGGVITLRNPANQIVFEANYVGAFAGTDPNDYGYLSATHQSLVLSPEFQGAFLPYQRVVAKAGGANTNGLSNPGYDVSGNPLALGNSPPLAFDDLTATDAHTPLSALDVLHNDTDLDLTDAIRVVAVGTNGNVSGATNYSVLGARLSINNSPTTGATVRYEPTASGFLTSLPQGSNVVDTFQYSILDSSNGVDHARGATAPEIALNLAKATATVTVNLRGVNSAPTPQPDSVGTRPNLTTAEDALLDFTAVANLLFNDTDPNSDDNNTTLNIVSIAPTNGYVPNRLVIFTALGATVTLDIRFNRNETHLTYDPRGSAILNALGFGQTTNDTFYYNVNDRYNAIGTTSVSIEVTGVNDTGTPNPNSFATDEDTVLPISNAALLGDDSDPDSGAVLTISAVTPISALGASVTHDGTNIVYDPTISSNLNALASKEFASDTFTYTAMDEHGLSSNAVVTVLVAGMNDRPISQADAGAIDEDSLFTASPPGVLGNDREPDINGLPPDDSFRVIPFANYLTAQGAAVMIAADGSFTLDPRGAFDWLPVGLQTNQLFDYVVMDHSLSVAKDDEFSVTATTANNLLPVLANDVVLSEAGGDLHLTGISTPNHGGSVALNAASNAVLYTPLAGYVGPETFSYTVADGLGGTDTAIVTVTVTGSRLYAIADAFTVAKGTTNTLDLLVNDSILPATGAALSITAFGAPTLGGLVSFNGVGPNNFVSYTPNPAQPTPFVETFAYTIAGGGLVGTGTVSVMVIDRANVLAANNDSFTVIANGGNISLDVLANDLILPGPNTNLVITSFTTNSVLGTVSLNAARTRLVYKPSSSVSNHQEPLISYSVSDSAGGTATASVSIRVVPGGFIANDDTFVVVKNSTNTLPVMVNDVILPNLGQTLFISGLGIGGNAPNHGGSVGINGPGTGLIYTPAPGFTGGEDFTYEISDGSPARALGHVHVVVLDNSPATSNPDTYRVGRDSANNVLLVLRNDYPLPKTPGAFTITAVRTNGVQASIAINGSSANNSLLYTPATGFIGTDFFHYEFTDTLGNRGTNSVTVAVGSLAPRDDAFTVLSDTAANLLDVLANDLAYPDGSSVRAIYQLGAADQGGSVATNPAATAVLYTPAPGFVGVEQFSYVLKDDSTNLFSALATVRVSARGSDRDTNTVTLTVIGVNDAPTITNTVPVPLITDKVPGTPFANVRIHDLDNHGMELLTVTVVIDDIAKGSFANLGGFVQGPPGTYTWNGTPTNVTAAIRGLVFIPTENRILVPAIENTIFTIFANDTHVTTTNSVVQPVQAVNDLPVVSGTVPGLRVFNRGTLRPFYKTLITEVDDTSTQSLVIRVTLDNPIKGYFTALGGFSSNAPGVYALSNVTGAAATVALRGLIFVPTTADRVAQGTNETTRLTISVDDHFAPPVLDTNTTVVAIAGLVARLQQAVLGSSGADDEYGGAVAATRDFVAAGQRKDDNNDHTGSVYVYARRLDGSEAWDESKKLLPPGGSHDDFFGTALGMSGDLLVVGAPGDDTRGSAAGAAYIFSRNQGGTNQWGFITKLTASDGVAGDEFGFSVAIDGNTIVVGAYKSNPLGSDSGSLYVFEPSGTNWTQVRKVTAAGGSAGDEFAKRVAISGDTIVGGAWHRDEVVNHAGAAYVFSRHLGGSNNWGQVKKLLAGNGSGHDHFGTGAAIDGDLIVIGASADDEFGDNSGAAFLFARHQGGSNNWGLVKLLLPGDPGSAERFGHTVGVDGDNVVVGAPLSDGTGSDSGAAYLFSRNAGGTNQWGQTEKFVPGANSANGRFGTAVSVKHSTLVIGAPFEQPGGPKTGTIYIYRLKYNNPPMLFRPITDQFVAPNVPFAFALPPGTFDDPDLRESLVLSTGPLPAWVSFDPLTATFSGLPTPANFGSHPINMFATDEDQAGAAGSFNIIVGFSPPDTVGPVATPPGNVTVECDAAVPATDFAGGSAIDNTDPSPTVMFVGDVTNGVCPRIITRTYRATDWFANSSTCSQTITVQDNTPPTLTCPTNPVVEFGAAWSFTPPIASDNCGTANLSVVNTFTNARCGATFAATRIWLVQDTCGNSLTCTQVVTLIDTTMPDLTCPTNLMVACAAGIPAPDFTGGSVSDLADPNPVVAHVGDLSVGTNPRVITRTYSATDACGNSNTCAQTITVQDPVAPTLGCPPDLSLMADTNTCTLTTNALGTPTVSDDCTVSVTNDAPATFPLGVTLVSWTATDAGGNATTCTQSVTVVDSTLAITLQPDSQTNQSGSNVVFTVNATGCAPLSYQWYFDTNPLDAETNATLTLTNLQPAQAGDYSVYVSNPGGNVISAVATLVVMSDSNSPPLARNDGAATTKNQAVIITLSDVLANDIDPNLDAISITNVSVASTNGATVAWAGGDITYTPVSNFTGTDRFSYTIADVCGSTAIAEVEVLVVCAPLPAPDQLTIKSVPEGQLVLYHGTPDETYVLQRSSDLSNWTPILTNAPPSGILQYVETSVPAGSAFYRVLKP